MVEKIASGHFLTKSRGFHFHQWSAIQLVNDSSPNLVMTGNSEIDKYLNQHRFHYFHYNVRLIEGNKINELQGAERNTSIYLAVRTDTSHHCSVTDRQTDRGVSSWSSLGWADLHWGGGKKFG